MAAVAPLVPVELTDKDFEAFVKGYGVVVIDCWAPWCGPCKRIDPIVKDLATEYGGRVAFGKLNTDEQPQIAMRYGVMSLPTLLVFKNGQRVDQIVGLMPKDQLKTKIDRHA